jgi:hypothetical protein
MRQSYHVKVRGRASFLGVEQMGQLTHCGFAKQFYVRPNRMKNDRRRHFNE